MKKLLSLLLALAMTLSVAACAPASTAEEPQDTAVAEETVSTYPLTLTDQAGREVVIEEQPQKLVSAYYITTSAMIALDLDDRLVGIESKPQKRPIYALSAPELLELPNVGTLKEFDLEGCAALEPDLVIMPMKLKDAAASLEELGIPVLVVNPESQQSLIEMLTLIGTAAGVPEKASALTDYIELLQANLTEMLAEAETKPRVYLAGNSSLLSTAGDAMYQSNMIRLANAENVAAEITDTYWAEIDYEQLLAWNPEYIVLASDAEYTVDDVLNDPNLADCAAVAEGHVIQLPSDVEAWDSPVPSGILGAVWLANQLHPDLVIDDACNSFLNEYYELFYQINYNENN